MTNSGRFVPATSRLRTLAAVLLIAMLQVACSGGSNGSNAQPSATGTVGILLTDAPSDLFSEINLTLTEVSVIGGADDSDGQQTVFSGSKTVNLLDLTNYSEPVAFGEVAVGSYTKLRLRISDLELVPKDGSPAIYPMLPANGKIDLLDQDGFDVLPGRTLLVEIDVDANKSIKITGAGNSGQYLFRPVVKVQISLGSDLPDKLARLEGIVEEISSDVDGRFEICAVDNPDNCLDINSGADTSFFGADGMPAAFADLALGQTVVVIGRYVPEGAEDDNGNGTDIDVELDAVVVQIGGNSTLVTGSVVTGPDANRFLILEAAGDGALVNDSEIAVELQDGTRIFDQETETDETAIVVGADVQVEGFLMPPESGGTPLMLAAIIFVAPEASDQVSGVILAGSVDTATRTFELPGPTAPICVEVPTDAGIIEVNTSTSEVTSGAAFADVIIEGRSVDAFGTAPGESTGGCFVADEVIVETTGSP